MKLYNRIVCNVIARRAGCAVREIWPWQHLDEDLEVGPVQRLLIALDLEQVLGAEMPVDRLTEVVTVGELQRILLRTVSHARRNGLLQRAVTPHLA